MNKIKLHTGDSSKVLKKYPDNHFDSIVTDPPYGIEFLGKDWDKNTGAIEVWQECLRVLKPGGHILAFSAARTYHRLATNLEDIGFEIRDQIMWIYGSGFPKGQDMGKLIEKRKGKKVKEKYDNTSYEDTRTVKNSGHGTSGRCNKCNSSGWITGNGYKCPSKDPDCPQPWISPKLNEWSGWKTGLKPAHEPIVMATKPFKGSTIDNVLKHGTGAINIDDTRVEVTDTKTFAGNSIGYKTVPEEKRTGDNIYGFKKQDADEPIQTPQGRYPANVIMSEEEGKVLDEKTGIIKSVGGKRKKEDGDYSGSGYTIKNQKGADTNLYVNEPPKGASKYYYCPKVSRKERNIGCDMHEPMTAKDVGPWSETGERLAVKLDKMTTKHNNHPTVKPVALMKYLVTLVTPKGGKVLDPFNGSGSTGMAVKEFGGEYVGIDLNKDYIRIAKKRIKAWEKK